MKSASNTPVTQLPEDPHNCTGGLDSARDDHAVSVVDARGRELVRHSLEHSAAGLAELINVLAPAGVCEVAIERPDGPVVEALLEARMTVVVISPNQVKNLRGRYFSAGNEDDRFDAFVLADTLRTDRTRLRPLTPDREATIALRRACRARQASSATVSRPPPAASPPAQRVPRCGRPVRRDRLADQPGVTDPFRHPRSRRLAIPEAHGGLADQRRLLRPSRPVLHARLSAAPRGAVGEHGPTQAHVTRALLCSPPLSNRSRPYPPKSATN